MFNKVELKKDLYCNNGHVIQAGSKGKMIRKEKQAFNGFMCWVAFGEELHAVWENELKRVLF